MTRRLIIIIAILVALLPVWAGYMVSAEPIVGAGLKISEIKLGGGNEPKEFVELYNDSNSPIDLTGIRLEYAKTSFNANYCAESDWKTYASPSSVVTVKTLSGSAEPFSFVVIEISLTDNTAGSLRLSKSTDDEFVQYDLVGWGTVSPCYDTIAAPIPSAGKVIKRNFDSDGHLGSEFVVHDTPLPGDDLCLVENCYPEPAEEPDEESAPITVYKEAYITELLPDPKSPKIDSQDEFIELYNPYDEPLNLDNYILYTASKSSTYKFLLQDVVLQPGEYRAFYSATTGLSLVNSSGYAWLTAPDQTVAFETAWYPESLGGDVAWAISEAGWQATATPTPSAPNQITTINPDTVIAGIVKDCPVGKSRNPVTGRCRNNVVAVAKQPCKSNQERNPETGRCRNIVSSKTTACVAGYERNAETNRCRKVASATTTRHDDDSGSSTNKINFLIIIVATGLLVGYAGYEYRQDIANAYFRIRQRLGPDKEEVVQ